MGKRKSFKPPAAGKKSHGKLPSQFDCPFCNSRLAVRCHMDREAQTARVHCTACEKDWATRINDLSEAVDVYRSVGGMGLELRARRQQTDFHCQCLNLLDGKPHKLTAGGALYSCNAPSCLTKWRCVANGLTPLRRRQLPDQQHAAVAA